MTILFPPRTFTLSPLILSILSVPPHFSLWDPPFLPPYRCYLSTTEVSGLTSWVFRIIVGKEPLSFRNFSYIFPATLPFFFTCPHHHAPHRYKTLSVAHPNSQYPVFPKHTTTMEAPLSSPSLQKQQNQHTYFTRSSKSSKQADTTAPQLQQSHAAAPLARDDGTSLLLKDHTLLFEAAKRAQMAVMMREFEGVGI